MARDIETIAPERARRAAALQTRRPRKAIVPSRDDPSQDEPEASVLMRPQCDLCGQPARVHVLEGYLHGQPVLRRFCLRCAPEAPDWHDGSKPGKAKLRLSILIGLFGTALGILALFGDQLFPQSIGVGFGWHKGGGLAVGALLLLIGALSRADLIALGGGLLFVGAFVAGMFGWAHSPGVGWKQQILLEISAACVILCVLGRLGLAAYVRRLIHSPPNAPTARRGSRIQG